jgi:indole-3-glycerol phosphate synthase
MNRHLESILTEKRREVAKLKERPPRGHAADNLPKRDFRNAISVPERINVIAEIKFRSPSAGALRAQGDPVSIGRLYEENGAAAISLITDKHFFGGRKAFLPEVKRAVALPVLRKDFIIDEIQIIESRTYGADAILLIARILSEGQLKRFLDISKDLGLSVLTEVHDKSDLEKAVGCGAEIIGINNRDLDTFRVDLETTVLLAPHVPHSCVLVSESGIRDAKDIELLRAKGLQAALIGSAIMTSPHMGKKTRELTDAGRNGSPGHGAG